MSADRLRRWIDERVPLRAVLEELRRKRVPHHRHSIWYYFGGMTLFLFGVQVATGGLLLLYYRPSAAEAYESVQFIMTRVPFGWLIRSVHAWSANLMIATACAHLFSVIFLHAYRRPREVTWTSGALLLLLLFAFGFTGYLLPWNTLAFFATRVGTDIAGSVPGAGHFIVRFTRGGTEVTGATLTRMFGVHVAILPAIATALLTVHLLLIQWHGMSVPPSIDAESRRAGRPIPSVPFFPHFVLHDLFAWTIALALLAGLAAFFPWELGVKADPFASAPAGIRPEWYFLWAFQILKFAPSTVLGVNGELVVVATLGLLGLFLIGFPFLVRDTARARRVIMVVAGSTLAVMVIMTMLALRARGGPTP